MAKSLLESVKGIGKDIGNEVDKLGQLGLEYLESSYNNDINLLTFFSNLVLKPIQIEFENRQKSLDVIIDILKFIIPIEFTLLITSFSVESLKASFGWLLGILIVLIALLCFILYKRYRLTGNYILINKNVYEILTDHYEKNSIDKLTNAEEIRKILLKKRQGKLQMMHNNFEKKIEDQERNKK